jgi:hypothetical protein
VQAVRGGRCTGLGLLALVVLVISACGGGDGGDNRVEEDTHSFTYPEGWDELDADFIAEAPNNLSSVSVGPEPTGVNLVTVGSFRVAVSITRSNLDQYRDEITDGVEQLFTQADGSVEEGPIPITVGGLDGYRFEGTSAVPAEDAENVHTRSIQVYDGMTGFFINCQYAPDAETDILAGCEQVVESFSTE